MTCGLIPATILHAVLGSAIPGGCFGDKSTESCSALQLFRIPPHFCFCHQMNSWPSEGEGRGCLSPLDFESISKKMLFFQFRGVKTKFHHKFWPPLEKSLGKSPTGPSWKKSLRRPWMNLWVVEQQVQMDVSIWDAVHSHSMGVSAEWSRCLSSGAQRASDSVAPLWQSSAGWMPARIERLFAGVGRRHPVTISMASLLAGQWGRCEHCGTWQERSTLLQNGPG